MTRISLQENLYKFKLIIICVLFFALLLLFSLIFSCACIPFLLDFFHRSPSMSLVRINMFRVSHMCAPHSFFHILFSVLFSYFFNCMGVCVFSVSFFNFVVVTRFYCLFLYFFPVVVVVLHHTPRLWRLFTSITIKTLFLASFSTSILIVCLRVLYTLHTYIIWIPWYSIQCSLANADTLTLQHSHFIQLVLYVQVLTCMCFPSSVSRFSLLPPSLSLSSRFPVRTTSVDAFSK